MQRSANYRTHPFAEAEETRASFRERVGHPLLGERRRKALNRRPGKAWEWISAGGATPLSHTYFQNVVHIVFSSKEWRKIIPTQMKERLWEYMAGICQHRNIFVHAIGGMEDHIHMLLQFPPTLMIADAIRDIKANSRSQQSMESDRRPSS